MGAKCFHLSDNASQVIFPSENACQVLFPSGNACQVLFPSDNACQVLFPSDNACQALFLSDNACQVLPFITQRMSGAFSIRPCMSSAFIHQIMHVKLFHSSDNACQALHNQTMHVNYFCPSDNARQVLSFIMQRMPGAFIHPTMYAKCFRPSTGA